MNNTDTTRTGLEVAVIGMAGRFPGANNYREFWENLKNGVESITFFTDQELQLSGINKETFNTSNYIKGRGTPLENIEYFDASFFGYTPIEAEILNPQIRIFLECSWETLEDAGYDPFAYDGRIGLFAGAATSLYWEGQVLLSGKLTEIGMFTTGLITDKDHLATIVSYKLNLKGPSCIVQTACSTSLVAIHMASRAVLSGECHIALAGGITIQDVQNQGYVYTEGMTNSPDGHCRAFDAKSKGTFGGNGVAIVALKRLKKAIEDGDHIYAIVKGSAINNDGNLKVGYTAPSVEGQAYVIRTALAMARVEPKTISYIETHGTGTTLGDPIEIEALKVAFQPSESALPLKKNSIPIGTVKTNVGHLNCAAGAAGFIKTVLALYNRLIPPSLHFETPNPKINLQDSPFYVNIKLREWKNDEYPLRAGVSSFGIGGTNAHVTLEEAPHTSHESTSISSQITSNLHQLIVLSAKTSTALEQLTQNLTTFLKKNQEIDIANLSYTLQVGRTAHKARQMTVASTLQELTETLSNPTPLKLRSSVYDTEKPQIIFMFPGQGTQYVNMGRDLYQNEPLFREEIDRCLKLLKPLLKDDIKEILYPTSIAQTNANDPINLTQISHLVIFIIEYALAQLFIKLGINPVAMIGYSLGEYTAACIAGVFTLENALKLIVIRGKLIEKVPQGIMLSVPLPKEELLPLLDNEISLAIDNGPSCIAAGAIPVMEEFEKRLKEKKLLCMRLPTSHAVHSHMMEPILPEFETLLKEISIQKPQIPYISNMTGNWITVEDAQNPTYWAAHMKKTVRFTESLDKLLLEENTIFIEIGPGASLSTFVRQRLTTTGQKNTSSKRLVLTLLRHPQENIPDSRYLLDRIGQLWLHGVNIPWQHLHHKEKRKRIPLPTYPFERKYSWYKKNFPTLNKDISSQHSPAATKTESPDWFYTPSWKKTPSPESIGEKNKSDDKRKYLIFKDELGIAGEIVKKLSHNGHEVISILKGEQFSRSGDSEYTINTNQSEDYNLLIRHLIEETREPETVIHLWSLTSPNEPGTGIDTFTQLQEIGYNSLVFLTQALEKNRLIQSAAVPQSGKNPLRLIVVTNQVQLVNDNEEICPEKTSILGPCKVIPLEYNNISCQNIDILIPEGDTLHDTIPMSQLYAEIKAETNDTIIAYRDHTRWVQSFEPLRIEHDNILPLKLKKNGIYLVIGGLGNYGLIIAKYLAQTVQARLILVDLMEIPGNREWDDWLKTNEPNDLIGKKIKHLREIKELGGEVVYIQGDVANENQMQIIIEQIYKTFGTPNGIIHSAGTISTNPPTVISNLHPNEKQPPFKPKVQGLYTLENILAGKQIDFYLLTSCISSFVPLQGKCADIAVDCFTDAFSHTRNQKNKENWICLNWKKMSVGDTHLALHKLMNLQQLPQVIISDNLPQYWAFEDNKQPTSPQSAPPQHNPIENKTYGHIPPQDEIEIKLCEIWSGLIGIEKHNICINESFFELGGNSLYVINMISKIHKEFKVTPSITQIYNNPTIKDIAKIIKNMNYDEEVVVLLNSPSDAFPLPGEKKNIFCFPPQVGYGLIYRNLVPLIDDYSWYSFNFLETMEPGERLKKYADVITGIQPEGSFILFAYSLGGSLTFQVAHALENQGRIVSDIIFWDCFFSENSTLSAAQDYWQVVDKELSKDLERMGVSFLKDQVIKKMETYMEYIRKITKLEKINANVHLILSEEGRNSNNLNPDCWNKFIAKSATLYQGCGAHQAMFAPGAVETHAQITSMILANIQTGITKTGE